MPQKAGNDTGGRIGDPSSKPKVSSWRLWERNALASFHSDKWGWLRRNSFSSISFLSSSRDRTSFQANQAWAYHIAGWRRNVRSGRESHSILWLCLYLAYGWAQVANMINLYLLEFLDEVPPLAKVLDQINDRGTDHRKRHIMPSFMSYQRSTHRWIEKLKIHAFWLWLEPRGHWKCICPQSIKGLRLFRLRYVRWDTYLKVHHSRVVIVLAWEQSPPEFSRVDIGKWMIPCVPSTKASIKTSHTSNGVVDDTEFFMMRKVVYQLPYIESVEWYVG